MSFLKDGIPLNDIIESGSDTTYKTIYGSEFPSSSGTHSHSSNAPYSTGYEFGGADFSTYSKATIQTFNSDMIVNISRGYDVDPPFGAKHFRAILVGAGGGKGGKGGDSQHNINSGGNSGNVSNNTTGRIGAYGSVEYISDTEIKSINIFRIGKGGTDGANGNKTHNKTSTNFPSRNATGNSGQDGNRGNSTELVVDGDVLNSIEASGGLGGSGSNGSSVHWKGASAYNYERNYGGYNANAPTPSSNSARISDNSFDPSNYTGYGSPGTDGCVQIIWLWD